MVKRLKTGFSMALGVALLLQACASMLSGAVLFDPLVVKNDTGATMVKIARNLMAANLSVFLDIVTAIGILWLAVLLFGLLRRVNEIWAATALAFYALEAGMLIVSTFFGYGFIRLSERYFVSGDKALVLFGQVMLQTKTFTGSMLIIPFGLGAILFYYLLFKSKVLPVWLPLWGLIAVIPVLIGVPLMAYGVDVPFVVCVPYVPFEFFTGAYILICGLRENTPAGMGI